ncbi:MAG: hypothetical protein O7A08_11830 [SAR324 cluster bacterium]|nr:hypothetical protein [SAR324 cluster bacterium]MCZ6533639.1 hypothetical protein [SAR324 cluster bacterium]MCZ6627395.1 hypothetical protein [SAR324 cluster bacterium]MCZ6645445.1 hypothetical protein [SAR324 cluster bacterium]MCZ6728819.1 hypothetical protein [SAR324 cluster bacterium]
MLLVCCALLAACNPLPVYNPVNSENMVGRSVLVLEPSYIPPVSKELHTRIMNEVESRLQEFPHVGRVVTRKEFNALVKKNRRLRRSYRLLSDTLSVVGFPDQETASHLGKMQNVEMIVAAQLFYIPCEFCEGSNQLALLFYLVEAETGKILWRADFSESVSGDDLQLRSEEADDLVEALFDALDEDLRPKWQRLRFKQLAQRG